MFLLNKRNDSGFFAWYVSAFGLVTVSGCLGLLARVFFLACARVLPLWPERYSCSLVLGGCVVQSFGLRTFEDKNGRLSEAGGCRDRS